MNQITYNQDGTFSAVYTTQDGVTHHFHAPVSQAAYAKNLDGSTNNHFLSTGTLACTDTGCTTTISTAFPLTGDGSAQQAHCMYRFATASPAITLQQAAASVISDAEAAGGVPRIDGNGQVP